MSNRGTTAARALAALVLLCAAPARSDTAGDAVKSIEQGMALMKAGDLPAARAAFERARSLVPEKANPYRLLGIVDARLGDCARAVDELEAFLAKVAADDARAVEAITLRDRCKEELQPKLGTLVVDSVPTGAELRLDDADKPPDGTTPYRNERVSVGNHVVFVRKSGFLPASGGVAITRGGISALQLQLQPEPPPVVERPPAPPTPQPAAIVQRAPLPPKKKSKAWIAAAVVVPVVVGVGLFFAICVPTHCLGGGGNNNNSNLDGTGLPPIASGH